MNSCSVDHHKRNTIKVAAATVALGGLASLPFADALQEEEIPVGLATNPLGPDDLQNGNWVKPERWENDSLEFKFEYAPHGREAYLRAMWGKKDSTDWTAFLIDFVGNTSGKPNCSILMIFDTYNQRLEGNDPNMAKFPGVHNVNLDFDVPGGTLYDDPVLSGGFPENTTSFTWARAPSPLSNASGARLKSHTLLGILIKREALTSKSEDIGVRALLWNDVHNLDELDDPLGLLSPDTDWAKLSFKSYPVPEIPWPEIALIGTVGASAMVARKMSRRSFLCLPSRR